MHDNGPTVPNLRRYEPEASADPHAAERPAWPLAGERSQRGFGRGRLSGKDTRSIALGISLGANIVLLVSLLSLLVLGRIGQAAPGGSASGAGTALGSPTATSSVQPLTGWLQVVPSSVQLGCDNGQQTQLVVLKNGGPRKVQWQAVLSATGDQAGVEVSPHEGKLAAGASVPIKIQNQTHAGDSHGGASSQQGVIRFESNTPDAGAGPSLDYTATVCQ